VFLVRCLTRTIQNTIGGARNFLMKIIVPHHEISEPRKKNAPARAGAGGPAVNFMA
jgi:hypothetical protein